MRCAAVLLSICTLDAPAHAQDLPASALSEVESQDRLIGGFHMLSANDLLQVRFFDGQEQDLWEVVVDSAGEIHLPYVYSVSVAGMTPREASEMLTERFRQYYKNPLAEVTVLEFGEFEVYVLGTDIPGRMMRLANGARLLDLLRQIIGLRLGKYRRIHLVRGGFDLHALLTAPPGPIGTIANDSVYGSGSLLATATPSSVARSELGLPSYAGWLPWIEERKRDPASTVAVLDPLRAAREGELSAVNVVLEPGDLVYVPTAERFVEIEGTTLAGRYELLDEKTLGEVLRLAGTVDYQGDLANTVVERVDASGARLYWYVDLLPAMDKVSAIASFEVQSGDVIRIAAQERRVFVLGEVNVAGAFEHEYDMVVTDYLALAQGMTREANTGWLAIIRQPRDRRFPVQPAHVMQVNFKEIQKGHRLPNDYSILPGDVIYVPPKGFRFSFRDIIQTVSSGVSAVAVISSLSDSGGNSSNGNGSGDQPVNRQTSP